MHRVPLADQLPYRFYPPRVETFWLWASRFFINHLMWKKQRIQSIEMDGLDHLEAMRGRGDGVLITPNHSDHADSGVVFELARRVRWPFFYMAAYQVFTGIARVGLPRIGVFPVDREGCDLTAFKTGIEVLTKGQHPLVVFPEGEIYFQCDRITPLREGAAILAATAVKKAADSGKNVWVLPTAIKYRFVDGQDPMPALSAVMDNLEAQFTWRHRPELSLSDRIYRFAEGMLGLKELEYLGSTQTGPLKERLTNFREHILNQIEDRRLHKRQTDAVPVRVKELRRACLEALADPKTTPTEAEALRRDLEDLFGVMKLFSYPGDYIRECPTLERVAEIMTKLEEDCLNVDLPVPRAPRRAILRLGPPIDARERLKAAGGRLRHAGAELTSELEAQIQALLDSIGPGRPITPPSPLAAPPAQATPQVQSSSV
jgi:1-acyl-sn-glycerol-3-phosphate acyltransferase